MFPQPLIIPYYPKANSVRSNGSETESLNAFNVRRQNMPVRKPLRQSMDLTLSIDCNSNTPLKPHNQNEGVAGNIQYPVASKMREMLANDGKIPLERPVGESIFDYCIDGQTTPNDQGNFQ